MTLKASMITDVQTVFLNNDEFAENVNYLFRGGGVVTVSAIVHRGEFSYYSPAGEVVLYDIAVSLADACEPNGVPRSKVNTGGDQIEVKHKNGDIELTRFTVLKVTGNDINGMYRLALK